MEIKKSSGVKRSLLLLVVCTICRNTTALVVNGVNIPHARETSLSRALGPTHKWPETWPYTSADLTPMDPMNDQLFYTLPKFVHHAAKESRDALTKYYECVLPTAPATSVLDLCSSWTSHYPGSWKPAGVRVVALGLNPLELALNPSKTEWTLQNLNKDPVLPFEDSTFDVITNSLSVDYLTKPKDIFKEMYRVVKPGGLASMAFTNRCFPTKIVPIWESPFSDLNHARIIGNYFHFSAPWEEINVVDVSAPGRSGQQDPMIIVQARKAI
mmetsp:Transcript_45513/g.91871  ORF Transcript_45513/g.91871 Transcript_45513/m.91871 type:complete len:270 (+) Transcript_45513:59-868(+)